MKLHHIGIIIKDLDLWEKHFIFEKKINDLIDPIQNSRLALYKNFSETYIELIQPLNKSAFTWNSLMKNGNHINHFCYFDISEIQVQELAVLKKMIYLMGPIPALLFDNKRVMFYYTRNREIVEFLIAD